MPPKNTSDDRTLLLVRGSALVPPELYMQVWVEGPPNDCVGFPEMFAQARCWKADTIEEADLVVFTGGVDVNPALYGAKKSQWVSTSPDRDKRDIEVYNQCYQQGIPMMGVCRGAQFGCAMNGGTLFQDIDGHHGDHQIHTTQDNRIFPSSSVHHQMCREDKNMDVLAYASGVSTKRLIEDGSVEEGVTDKEVEAFFYRDSCFLGFQGHPEYKGYATYTHWCIKQIEELIVNNPDIEVVKGVYRVKASVMQERAMILDAVDRISKTVAKKGAK